MKLATKYNHTEIESKWQKCWIEEKIYSPNLIKSKKPFYNLMMFPYPSAEGLHVGNMYAFVGADIFGRFQRMQGKDVFEPIGLDGFGIHSENYAIKIGEHPAQHAKVTQKRFYAQLASIGNGFDWTKTLETYDPSYYKWTQWLFVKMFKAGLAYKGNALVNWCPSDKTVLSDEQVINGRCERCGTEVAKREMSSWFFRITKYADRLLENIEKIDWPEKIKIAQRQWIGRSKGLSIDFKIQMNNRHSASKFKIKVWTKFWETVFGTTFLVVAPEYAQKNLLKFVPKKNKKEADEYIKMSLLKSSEERKELKEKSGVFMGLYAINQVNNKEVPIWVADYILSSVGTGAVMGVPAHDERDFDFAKKYNLDIFPVVVPEREYQDKNARSYYKRRARLHKELIIALAGEANTADKKMILGGGWAVFLQVGREFRDFEDIDLIVMEEDLDWWRETLESHDLKISNMFPEGKNKKYYFQATKKDIHVDVSVIRLDKTGKILLLDSENPETSNQSFEEMFDLKEIERLPIFALNKGVLYDWKKFVGEVKRELRWKERADFLFMGLESYEGPGLLINSEKFDGMDAWSEGKEKMAQWMIKEGFAKWETNYHLRDWGISRQRYWGPPIPMVFCENCKKNGRGERKDMSGWYTVPEESLPVILPYIKNYQPRGTGASPLAQDKEWVKVTCPGCGSRAQRETDVSDVFVDSSWYFLAYPNLGTEEWKGKKSPLNSEITKHWLPVGQYTGGAEHSVLHLMYARFVTMVLHDMKLLNFEEPFTSFYAHGLLIKDGAKMSKSKGNVVVPDKYINKFGADTLRTYLMFLGPFDQGGDFRDTGIEGMSRFLNRVWKLYQNQTNKKNDKSVYSKLHQTVKKVTEDLESFKFNTAIAAIMELVNELTSHQSQVTNHSLRVLAQLLAPFAPHITEEIWCEVLGQKFSVHTSQWPKYDINLTIKDYIDIVIQIDGRLRSSLTVKSEQSKSKKEIEELARKDPKIAKWLGRGKIKRVVFVPAKLINFVLE